MLLVAIIATVITANAQYNMGILPMAPLLPTELTPRQPMSVDIPNQMVHTCRATTALAAIQPTTTTIRPTATVTLTQIPTEAEQRIIQPIMVPDRPFTPALVEDSIITTATAIRPMCRNVDN